MATIYPINVLNDLLTAFGRQGGGLLAGTDIFTDRSLARGQAVTIQLPVQNVQIAQASRISEQVVKDGKAFFFWRKDRYSSHLDLIELTLSGTTRSLAYEPLWAGNPFLQQLGQDVEEKIDSFLPPFLRGVTAGATGPTAKQAQWLQFWALTRENYVDEVGINNHHVRLRTPGLPLQVDFVGHFAAPIQWTQNAQNPFLADWNLKLVVHYTTPDLDIMFNQASSLIFQE